MCLCVLNLDIIYSFHLTRLIYLSLYSKRCTVYNTVHTDPIIHCGLHTAPHSSMQCSIQVWWLPGSVLDQPVSASGLWQTAIGYCQIVKKPFFVNVKSFFFFCIATHCIYVQPRKSVSFIPFCYSVWLLLWLLYS